MILVLVVALILGVSIHFLGGRAGLLSNAAGALRAPLQRSALAITDWLEGIYGYMYNYDQLQAENEELRAQLADAQEQVRLAADANEENQRLRELLNLAEKRSDFVFESARVIAWDSSNWTSRFTISKGESSGIELGDCVVTEYEALVGQVVELGDTWAVVRTIIDVDMGAGALVGTTGSAATVVGDFTLMQRERVKLAYLVDSSQVFTGDTVLTSGEGSTYPQGLVIGTIETLETEAGGQNIYGVVEPACDLDSLTQVFVIKDYEIVE